MGGWGTGQIGQVRRASVLSCLLKDASPQHCLSGTAHCSVALAGCLHEEGWRTWREVVRGSFGLWDSCTCVFDLVGGYVAELSWKGCPRDDRSGDGVENPNVTELKRYLECPREQRVRSRRASGL